MAMSTKTPAPDPIWGCFERPKGTLAERLQTAADLVRAWSNGSALTFQLHDVRGGELGSTEILPSGRHLDERTGALSYLPDLLVTCKNAGKVYGFHVWGEEAGAVLLRGELSDDVTLQEGDTCCIRFGSMTVVFP